MSRWRFRLHSEIWMTLAALLAVTGPPGPAAAARPPAASTLPRNPVHLPRGSGPMADTVLAVVDRNRTITRSGFERSWSQLRPPSRPDRLTPETSREFLDLLIGREALGARALRDRFTMTREESLKLAGLRDRLTLQAALDSALHEVQERMLASGDTVTDAGALGVAARETLVVRLDPRWNEPALGRLAAVFEALPRPSRDSSLMVQIRTLGVLPVVDSSERATPLAVPADDEPFTVADLLEAWARLNPLERPRIGSADQVRDLVKNGLFERRMRADARRRRLDRRPDIARALEREHEFYAVERYVGREVYARIDTTGAAVRRFFDAHAEEFAIPTRAVVTRLTLPDRGAAAAMAVRLARGAEAESLVAAAARRGVSYRAEVTAASDARLFASAMAAGPDAVVGPDSVEGGWRVARVHEFRPARPRSFEEARVLAAQRWYGEEGERLMVALLDRLRRETHVIVNPRAVRALTEP